MPRLLIFAPCEKVILGQGDNSLSLISVLQEFQVHRPPGAPDVPSPIQVPLTWSALALWQRTDEDQGRTYRQRVSLSDPQNQTLLVGEISFVLEKDTHRTVSQIFGFPFSVVGPYVLKLSLLNQTQWEEVASFPISVTLVGMAVPMAAQRPQ